jgi:hypothetical protein
MTSERTPRHRDRRLLSVVMAVGALLTLALGPAMAQSDTRAIGATRHDGAVLHLTFLTRQQEALDTEVADDLDEVDEADDDQGEVDEDAQGDDSQDESADENDQGEDDQGDSAKPAAKVHKDSTAAADEDDGDEADDNDADENDSEEHDGDSSHDDGDSHGEHDGGDDD